MNDHELTGAQRPAPSDTWLDRGIRRRVLQQLQAIQGASLTVRDAHGQHRFGDADSDLCASIRIHDAGFYRAVALAGSNGAAESFMHGGWQCDDLTALIRVFVRNRELLDGLEGGSAWLRNALLKFTLLLNRNTRQGARRNIARHYDLGNDLFKLFLDEHLMYSSAIYRHAHDDLESASQHKLHTIAEKLDVGANDHVLEIGTGWGGLAVYLAQTRGCRVTTTTISSEQHRHAQALVQQLGLTDRVTVLQQDYRALQGQYDKLVSVEMIEAVGHQYLDNYLRRCDALLKPDGLALIQAITIEDHRYQQALRSVDFIKKHIFPGSFIPSIGAILHSNARNTQMRLIHLEDFGASYARTLADWRARFTHNLQAVSDLGYSREFQRMWLFYLCYCEGGFIEKAIGCAHLLLAKPGNRRDQLLACK